LRHVGFANHLGQWIGLKNTKSGIGCLANVYIIRRVGWIILVAENRSSDSVSLALDTDTPEQCGGAPAIVFNRNQVHTIFVDDFPISWQLVGHLDSSSSIPVKVPLHMIVYNFSSRNTIDGNIEAYTGPFIAVRFNLDERIAI
jgi:hypothetical protein